jgi:hypothetical protein
MEQSVPVRDTLELYSPLSVDECCQRLKNHTVTSLPWGVWIQASGGGPELNGRIRGHRFRLLRPHVMNSSVPELIGTLDPGPKGGSVLKARIRLTFGWPRSGSKNDQDIDYLLDALGRISQFARIECK